MKSTRALKTTRALGQTLLWAALTATQASAQETKETPRLKPSETLGRELKTLTDEIGKTLRDKH